MRGRGQEQLADAQPVGVLAALPGGLSNRSSLPWGDRHRSIRFVPPVSGYTDEKCGTEFDADADAVAKDVTEQD